MSHRRSSRAWASVSLSVLLALTLAPAGCGIPSADQCSIGGGGDHQCERILGVAAGQAFCDNGTCRPKAPPAPAQGGQDAPACVSTAQCTTENGGRPSVCLEPGVKPCVNIVNDVCYAVGDGWKEAKSPIFVGVLVAKTILENDGSETPQPYSELLEKSIQMAEAEWFAQTTGGLNVGGVRRPLVAVYCNHKADQELLKRAYDHLTLGLGAPAVIAEVASDVLPFIDDVKARGTFLYLSDGGSETLGPIGKTNGQAYYSVAPATYSVPLMKEWVKRLEAQVRAARALPPETPIKVATVGARIPTTADYLTQLENELELNGGKAHDQPASYKEFNPVYSTTHDPDFFAVAQAVVAFEPDIILTTEGRDFHLWHLPLIEALWPASRPFKPHYVTTEDAAFPLRLAHSVGGNDALRKRIDGAWLALDPESQPVFDDFMKRYEARFKEPNESEVITGFDAFYATAYGIAAALTSATVQPSSLKGTDIAAALSARLVGGEGAQKTPFVPSMIAPSVASLAQGGKLDLVGTTGALDWDPVTGTAGQDAALYCVVREPGVGINVIDAGLYYHYRTKSIEGDIDAAACQRQ